MKIFLARLFNILTVITTSFVVISSYFFITSFRETDDPVRFFMNMGGFYLIIIGLNFLVVGKVTLWNSMK